MIDRPASHWWGEETFETHPAPGCCNENIETKFKPNIPAGCEPFCDSGVDILGVHAQRDELYRGKNYRMLGLARRWL